MPPKYYIFRIKLKGKVFPVKKMKKKKKEEIFKSCINKLLAA